MNARAEMMQRIRLANGAGASSPARTIPRDYLRHAPGLDPGDRAGILDEFEQRLTRYGARLRRTPVAGIAAAVDTELRAASARSILAPPGLPEAWLSRWTGRAEHHVVRDEPPLTPLELDDVDAIVTTCAAAIAQSGTIVLDGAAGQGRRAATLVPDCHLCVVAADQVKSSLPEVVPQLDPRRPTTWISGPSATVDIEMTRVQGVHGPRQLIVVLVEGENQNEPA
ncbi:LutC/YkgG family protein [Nocardia vermiculata]|nr:LUD domain-containing protein [Nocardia vermiculata]